MRCGERDFIAAIQMNGEEKTTTIAARTPAEARKKLRKAHGDAVKIMSVRSASEHT